MSVVSFVKSFLKVDPQLPALSPLSAAIFNGLAGAVFMWWFLRTSSLAQVEVWLVIWLCFSVIVVLITRYTGSLSRAIHWFSLVLFQSGLAMFLLIVDRSIIWYVVVASGIVLPAISFYFLPSVRSELSFMGRPHMRVTLAMNVFGLAGIWSGIAAAIALTVFPPIWWGALIFSGVVVSMLAAIIWWWYYLKTDLKKITKTTLVFGWVLAQLSLVILLWPTGFLAQGLLIAWVWYLVWLTIRYHLSDQGIDPKRHTYFLVSNIVAMALFLFFLARWK